jgi:hypothetical protein
MGFKQKLMASAYRHFPDNLRDQERVAETTGHFEKGTLQKRLDKENTTPFDLIGRQRCEPSRRDN